MTKGTWPSAAPGTMRLPSGLVVRGRGLRWPLPEGQEPEFGLYLLGAAPQPVRWESRWVRWRDFWLPSDRDDFASALRDVLKRAGSERVEIACRGGFGRTGTALACLAVIEGIPNDRAVAYVREHYSHRAVETPWQRQFVGRFETTGNGRSPA
jgi:protein-tyrosine phosphatase